MLEANEMKALRKVVGKTKIDRIRSQQIREYCGTQQLMSGWKEQVTRMDAERLVKISRYNRLPEEDLQ